MFSSITQLVLFNQCFGVDIIYAADRNHRLQPHLHCCRSLLTMSWGCSWLELIHDVAPFYSHSACSLCCFLYFGRRSSPLQHSLARHCAFTPWSRVLQLQSMRRPSDRKVKHRPAGIRRNDISLRRGLHYDVTIFTRIRPFALKRSSSCFNKILSNGPRRQYK